MLGLACLLLLALAASLTGACNPALSLASVGGGPHAWVEAQFRAGEAPGVPVEVAPDSRQLLRLAHGRPGDPHAASAALSDQAAPMGTPAPTDRPSPTATPVPTDTPLPTATLAATDTPPPTATPLPTATASPTHTPLPTATPVPTETPLPADTALPTETPAPTGAPPPTSAPPPPAPADSAPAQPASSPPTRIEAPSIGLDIPVTEMGWQAVNVGGVAATGWLVPEYAAGFHKGTAYPGHPGNTVVSGHNNVGGEVFRYLSDLNIGDEVRLYVATTPYRYRVAQKEIVVEDGASLEQRRQNARWIAPTDDERLTLVTCYPYPRSTHRLIVIARPAS